MPGQPQPKYPILGFAAGTPLLAAQGPVPIEDIKPGGRKRYQERMALPPAA